MRTAFRNFGVVLVAAGLVQPYAGIGAPVSVSNPSFEDISGQSTINEFTLVLPNGWSAYNPSNLVSGGGLYFGTLEPDGTFFDPAPNPTPEGNRVALLYNQTQKGAGEYGIEQTLGASLEALTQYTLQVEVGDIGSGTADGGSFYDLSGFPGYRIDLLAGTNVVVSDADSLTIAERSFATSTLQVTTDTNPAGLGEVLTIRLVSLNAPFEPDDNSAPFDAHEVDFDDVRLDAQFSPELFSTSNGVSYTLLLDSGLAHTNSTAAEFEAASVLNSDTDVYLDWQEYAAGTDPSNGLSFFTNRLTYSSEPVLEWLSVSNRTYAVSVATNLLTGFTELTNGLNLGIFTNSAGTNQPSAFYRVDVSLP